MDSSELIQKDRIQETLVTLFIETDNKNWNAVRDCFASEVHFDMTSLAGGEPIQLTPKQITDGWDEGLKEIEAIHHQAGNFKIQVNGSEATVFCYALASHYKKTESGNNTRMFVGSYDFELILEGEQWKISMFKFNLKCIDGNVDLK